MDPNEPIYMYINSTGTTRDDGETVRFSAIQKACSLFEQKFVLQKGILPRHKGMGCLFWNFIISDELMICAIQVGMETEGFAIYDTMMQMENEVS